MYILFGECEDPLLNMSSQSSCLMEDLPSRAILESPDLGCFCWYEVEDDTG